LTDRLPNMSTMTKPSRYMGGEKGSVIKSNQDVKLHVALAFPDVYEIGMSHVGLKILYGLINQRPEFWAERVMAVWPDLENALRQTRQPLTSLESGRPLDKFDVIGFSLQYELTYTNVLNMLDLAGLPLYAAERDRDMPIVIGGGPNAFNPEPLADFFDIFFLGDAEAGFMDVLDDIEEWKKSGRPKDELFEKLARRDGVYIPSFFQPEYNQGRLVRIRPARPDYQKVRRAVVSDLETSYYPEQPVVPFTRPVHDRLAVEVARGCTRGCRFCQAGYIYRPVRERTPKRVLDLAGCGIAATGQDEASFLSLSAGDYSALEPLMSAFMDRYSASHVALSLPSLRVKSLTPAIMQQIKRVRKTGFTIAPEAATQRLRDVINKDLTEDDLMFAAREAFSLGWRLIKLYFMIGLPTETMDDVAAISDLAKRVRGQNKGQINVSYAVFIPKPHTPFQWEPMLSLVDMQERIEFLKDRLRPPTLKAKWNPWETSVVEGLLSRGDRRLGKVIAYVHAHGGRFDAWNEHLKLDLWYQALESAGLELTDYFGAREYGSTLPWSHLDAGADEKYLWAERTKAIAGEVTPDCRFGDCQGCGVCDFDVIEPRLCPEEQRDIEIDTVPPTAGTRTKLVVNYAKQDQARLLSHLETISVFQRAFRRAGLTFAMSQGFHPQPKMVFASPLPVGVESRDEHLIVDLIDPPAPEEVTQQLANEMPVGFEILGTTVVDRSKPRPTISGARYRVETGPEDPLFDAESLRRLDSMDRLMVTKKSKKGVRSVDLLKLAQDIKVLTPSSVEITLLTGSEGSVRPLQAVGAVFDLDLDDLKDARVFKLETLIDLEDA
jgi:radical SAM family uncharacterized protein/radical SAM-linked protein